jgi:superfamily II DNA or RNA helicase
VLILVPATLIDQWTDELAGRFGIDCLRANRSGLEQIGREQAFGTNPWMRPGVWIVSVDYLKQPHVAEALPPDPWDLLVIDEAHTVCGESDRYAFCQHVARRSRRVVLLTATPHGGDVDRFDRLTSLGRTDRRDELTIFRRSRGIAGGAPARRVRWHRLALSDAEQRLLAALRAFERIVLRRAESRDHALLLLTVLRKRALSTTAALIQSIDRRLAWLGEPGSIAWAELTQARLTFDAEPDAESEDERLGLSVSSGLAAPHERIWLRRLRALADEAATDESRIERLASLIHRTNEPVIVFTEYRDSLDVIRRRLSLSRKTSLLHGGMEPAERRQQLRQFLDGQTSVLLATDVAGQGLNLQSRARWVVSLELPWNPVRLEQRIGRVDRIGQTRAPHLTLLVARDESESGLLTHLAMRVLSARRAIGADVLAGIAPPESDVAAALLTGQPIASVEPAPAEHRPSHRWVRPARVVSSILGRRRALAARWRGPGEPTSRPLLSLDTQSSAEMEPLVVALEPRVFRPGVLIFSVPLFTTDSELVTRELVSLRIDPGCGAGISAGRVDESLLRVAASHARAEVESRVPAIRQTIGRAARRLIRRERAIARIIDAEAATDEAQPSLFDRRETVAFEIRTKEEQRVSADMSTRLESLERATDLHAGEPQLEFVLSTVRR